jgi:hypothetical protein
VVVEVAAAASAAAIIDLIPDRSEAADAINSGAATTNVMPHLPLAVDRPTS